MVACNSELFVNVVGRGKRLTRSTTSFAWYSCTIVDVENFHRVVNEYQLTQKLGALTSTGRSITAVPKNIPDASVSWKKLSEVFYRVLHGLTKSRE